MPRPYHRGKRTDASTGNGAPAAQPVASSYTDPAIVQSVSNQYQATAPLPACIVPMGSTAPPSPHPSIPQPRHRHPQQQQQQQQQAPAAAGGVVPAPRVPQHYQGNGVVQLVASAMPRPPAQVQHSNNNVVQLVASAIPQPSHPHPHRGQSHLVTCTGCGAQFATVDALANHMNQAGHGTWHFCPYSAQGCTWSFVTAGLATEHSRTCQFQRRQHQQHQQHQQPLQQGVHTAPPAPRHYQPAHNSIPAPANSTNRRSYASAAASVPPPQQQQQQQPAAVPKANLVEGSALQADSKKTYDAIVKAFIEDPARGELQFPPTLTAQERHHVHKLCMHYSLEHASSGAGATRQLRIWKKNFSLPAASALSAEDGVLTGRLCDGYMGLQSLDDEYLQDHVQEVLALTKKPVARMQHALRHHLEKVHATEAVGSGFGGRRRVDGDAWFTSAPPPSLAPGAKEKTESLQSFRRKLPSFQMRDAIVNAVQKNTVTVVSGDTGCGKTTQLPQLLLDAGVAGKDKLILCTQPRRVSAISVANRVADERGERCGGTVGYSIRFENVASRGTRILYMTTGILLRRLHSDPQLKGVAAVVVDEVHERDVDTDFALLLLRDLVRQNNINLKLVVMSATIQVEKLVAYFNVPSKPPPPLIAIPGAMFDVKEYWLDDALQWLNLSPESSPAMAQAIKVRQKAAINEAELREKQQQQSGYEAMKTAALERLDKKATETIVPIDIICGIIEAYHGRNPLSSSVLVFLPGWAAIDKVMNTLKRSQIVRELSILPLHSSLTTQEQQLVFQRPAKNFRKIVLATNIAETSITIDDIVLVIDSCLHKGSSYDASGNTTSLTSQLIAKANGRQRRGRAGRCQAGVCVHLLPKVTYDALPEFLLPEIQRTALEEICLQVKAIVSDQACVEVLGKALDAPPAESIQHAVEHLTATGALDRRERLTSLGRVLATFPMHPSLGKMLLLGAALGVFEPMCTLASALSAKSPFVRPLPHQLAEARQALQQFDKGRFSDHFAVLELYQQWQRAPRRADFAYSHWADHHTLVSIDRMKGQLRRLMERCGFLKKVQQRGNSGNWESRYATNSALVRFALAHSLLPRLAVYENERKRRRDNIFCWDNKPCTFHPSSIHGRTQLRDIPGREIFVYFDRMRMESQLQLFDATAVSRSTFVVAAKTLDVVLTSSVSDAEAADEHCKFIPWCESSFSDRRRARETSVLVVDGGKKRFTVPDDVAQAVVEVHDIVNFCFAKALKHMDATAVDDDVVCALAALLGEPARKVDPTSLDTAAPSGDVRLGPAPASPPARLDEEEYDDLDDVAPEFDSSSSDDDGNEEAHGGGPGASHTGWAQKTATLGALTDNDADILVRAYGELSMVTRSIGSSTEGSKPVSAVVSTLKTSAVAAASEVDEDQPTEEEVGGGAAPSSSEDEDDGDEVIMNGFV